MKNRITLLVFGTAFAVLAITCLTPKSRADSKTDSLEAQVAQLQIALQQADLKIAKLSADAKRGREMPVLLGRRKALTGSGFVFQIENVSLKTLPVKVTLINPTFGKTNVFDLVLDGAKITPFAKEIGHLQGWTVAPGDLIHVEAQGYDGISKRID